MAKLSKRNKIVLSIVILFIISLVTIAIILEIQEQRRAEFERKYKDAEAYTTNIKYGLSESKRKEIFKSLVNLQDRYTRLYPDNQEKQAEAYDEIAYRYNCKKEIVQKIAVEGAEKGWVYDIK